MERYEVGKLLGEGAFSRVFYARKKSTGEERAVKRLKASHSWDKMKVMRELRGILRVPLHENIVQLYEVHKDASDTVCFVFEYMEGGSLHEILDHRRMENKTPLPNCEIRHILRQILSGIEHLHHHDTIHRDLKPENILMNGRVAKVADFSLARNTSETDPITTYVATRWYRAPEISLGSPNYSKPVDIFAVGCIAAELFTLEALFQSNDEFDQLVLIFKLLGSPMVHQWEEGVQLLKKMDVDLSIWSKWTGMAQENIRKFVHRDGQQVDDDVVDLLDRLLNLDPAHRISADMAMRHAFFATPPSTTTATTPFSVNSRKRPRNLVSASPKQPGPTNVMPIVNPYQRSQVF